MSSKLTAIHGITFEDYAAACGHLAQGMPESQIIEILGVEKPVWDDAMSQWGSRLGDLFTENMDYATQYSEIFANPKVGRFAEVETPAVDLDALLKIVPNLDSYQKIFWHISVASEVGVDPMTVLEEYGLDIGKWGMLNVHYMKVQNELLDHNHPDYNQRFAEFSNLMDHWRNHFAQQYASDKPDLADDIKF